MTHNYRILLHYYYFLCTFSVQNRTAVELRLSSLSAPSYPIYLFIFYVIYLFGYLFMYFYISFFFLFFFVTVFIGKYILIYLFTRKNKF